MIKLWQKWAVMIDVNNVCGHNCIYCPKHIRHLRKDQITQMTEDEIIRAIKSLEDWPGKIGFTGGEPLNYPDVPGLCKIVRELIPKEKALIFTSHEKRLTQFKGLIDDTFSEVYINFHNEEQKKVCLHHPLLLAVGDMAPDRATMKTLIENCWCNKMWSPIIGKKGVFFCDCALGLDTALDMDGGWPVEPGWWKRNDYSDQIEKYCYLCGMCLPYPGQNLADGDELISYGLYEKFKKHNLRNLKNMRVVEDRLTVDDIKRNSVGWEPWHNRQDRGYEGPEYVNLKIAIVSAWYNEELLAPLFLRHYDFADEIHIILDTATNDRTEEILRADPRVIIHRQVYPPDGLDWTIKQAKIDEVYSQVKSDWVFVVDADEFLFKSGEKDIKRFLARQPGEVMWAKLWQVYRHEWDKDIDYSKPPVSQRRHGIPLEPESRDYHMPDRAYLKPIVIRGGKDPKWNCGCHNYFGRLIECMDMMDGAHWHMADPGIAVRRRMQTKARQGRKNLQFGLGIQNHYITEKAILYECWLHRNDPIVIYTGFEEDECINSTKSPEAMNIVEFLNILHSTDRMDFFLKQIDNIFEKWGNENDERAVLEVFRLFPENGIFMNRIGEHLVRNNKHEKAKEVFISGLKYNPDYAELWCNLGYVFYLLRDYEQAYKYTKIALSIDDSNEIYKENLAIIEGALSDISEDNNQKDILRRMKEDWDKWAKEGARYYVHTTEKEENEEEFDQSGKDNVDNIIMPKLNLITDGKDPKTLRMLEIGCGIGRMTKHLAGIFGKVYGIDVSEEMTKRASERLRGVENTFFCVNNGFDLSFFRDSVFDFVFSFIVFQHIPEKEIIFNYIKEVYRVLKNKGVFMFQVQGCMDPQWLAMKKDTWHGETVTEEEISLIAGELGFTILEKKGQGTQYSWYIMKKQISVSIVIPVYNNIELTGTCVNSILKQEKNSNYEIIIVDNGSIDETNNYFNNLEIQKIRYFRLEENLGFVGGCNFGASHAEGDYIVFLNNDTEIQIGWLDNLLKTFQIRPDCGAVGCKLIYPDGTLQEAGGIIFSDGNGWNYGRGMNPGDPGFNFVREVDYCSGAALMVRRDLWDEIGGFDERYSPAYYEDTDLCFEIRKRGYKVYYQPKSVVVHHEGKTAGTDITYGFKKYQEINREKFIEKWKDELISQCPYDVKHVKKAAERGIKGKIFVLDHFLPMYDRASGSLRLFNILKMMKALDYHVVFIAMKNEAEERYRPIVEELGIETYTMQYFLKGNYIDTANLSAFLKEAGFDYALIEFWNLAKEWIPFLRRISKDTKIIVDSVDIHFIREIREAQLAKDSKLLEKAMANKQDEISTYRQADRVWVVTEDDKGAIEEYLGSRIPIDIVPNIHEKIDIKKVFEDTEDILFVGNFNHPPNRDAAFFLCNEIFPFIKNALKGVKLYIVGNNPQEDIKSLATEDIIVTGYVEDLTPYLLKSRLSVAPLRYGAGMKGKIGEALSWGLPVVTTSIGAEGMGLVDEIHVLIADEAKEFADKVIRLYNDGDLWDRLSKNGKAYIHDNFSPDAVKKKIEEIFLKDSGEKNSLPIKESVFGIEKIIKFSPPEFKNHLVSIIIPVKENWEYTKVCLDSISRYTDLPYEIVIVDNGSEIPIYKNLAKWRDRNPKISIRYLRLKENKGFAGGCNKGVDVSIGDYLIFLNNDTVVTPGWIKGLLIPLLNDGSIGITGPISNLVNGRQRIHDCPLNFNSPATLDYGKLASYQLKISKENLNTYITTEAIMGLCLCIRKSLFDEIGGFDEVFYPGNYEDSDLSMRIQLEGYSILICKDVFIYHFGNRTFQKGFDYRDVYLENMKRFKEKWGVEEEIHHEKEMYHEILRRKDGFDKNTFSVTKNTKGIFLNVFNKKSIKDILEFYSKKRFTKDVTLKIYHDGIDEKEIKDKILSNPAFHNLVEHNEITFINGTINHALDKNEENRYCLVFSWKDKISDELFYSEEMVIV